MEIIGIIGRAGDAKFAGTFWISSIRQEPGFKSILARRSVLPRLAFLEKVISHSQQKVSSSKVMEVSAQRFELLARPSAETER